MPENNHEITSEEPPTEPEGGSSTASDGSPGGHRRSPRSNLDLGSLRGQGKEMEHAEDQPPNARPPSTNGSSSNGGMEDVPGLSLLQALVNMTPFMTYFNFLALSRFDNKTEEGRIGKLANGHPFIYRLCCAADLLLRGVLVFLLVVAVAAIVLTSVYKLFIQDLDLWFIQQLRAPQ